MAYWAPAWRPRQLDLLTGLCAFTIKDALARGKATGSRLALIYWAISTQVSCNKVRACSHGWPFRLPSYLKFECPFIWGFDLTLTP